MINNSIEDPLAAIHALTGGLGADVAIEAVGVPETFELAAELIRPAGRVANIGVHGKPATLHREDPWIKEVPAERFVTHHFALDDMIEAYDVFGRAAETGALKVVLSRSS